MDVVYICRPGDDNEELRYSLRSLENLPHDEVWLAGYCPTWVRGVRVIPVEGRNDKQTSALNNLIAACQHMDVSDPFVVFNDDMYVMQPMDEIPNWHMGRLDEVIQEHAAGRPYRIAMEKTYQRLLELGHRPAELKSYELHMPMEIEKLGMLMALDLGKGIYGMHNRTMYGNLMGIGGTKHEDVKVYRGAKGNAYKDWPLLSTSDRTFKYHPAGRYIREQFLDASPYEIEGRATRASTAVRVSHVSYIHTP